MGVGYRIENRIFLRVVKYFDFEVVCVGFVRGMFRVIGGYGLIREGKE